MDILELLQWTDEQVLANTGKHLDSLQKAILEGVWQHQNYEEIADTHHLSYDHVKKPAWRLWKLLSETLGEDVKSSNVRSLLENRGFSTIYSNYGERLQIVGTNNGNITICGQNTPSPSPPDAPQNKNLSPIIDLTDAPALIDSSHRTSELSTLKQWILQTGTRLIAIYGLSGIGKSALALKLIEDIQTEFDCIIWRSLSNAPTLSTLQTELKQFFCRAQPTPLPTVIDYFRSSRCLVILDDVQNIFQPGQLAGQYLAGCEDYGKFFQQVATSSHQSCLILISWEKPRELTPLEGESRPARTLHLQGLGEQAAREILREKGLTDEEKWSELIALYQGHPYWLNIIASTIVELFNGSVSRFLAGGTWIFLGDLEPLLESHLARLSELETKVSYWLSSQDEAVDISDVPADSDLSQSEVWQAIQSLARRGLVEKVQVGAQVRFRINPVFQQYIQRKFRQ
ncbi:NB-ARC domain-containing protein [Kamptonema formosum]|uniref:NB-ARC domain-containing protein n=1 Tax=Kamptonema formosum TaxID=331992 RepID=UPI0003672155|nr:NB-ARC domain-containing protein [Oscillatoria sp. PCC 10802]